MYQKFIKTGCTAQRCSAMETRDHSKNGASPKSLMSRGDYKNLLTIVILLCLCVFSLATSAQKLRVAIFEPAGRADIGVKEAVRELISSVIVNTPGYMVLERELIDKVLAEYKFQESTLSETQFIEAGKLMGASLAIGSSVSSIGDNFFISAKVIDVQTGRVEMQRSAQTKSGTNDLVEIVEKMVGEMLHGASGSVTKQDVPKGPRIEYGQLGIFFAGTHDLELPEHGNVRVTVYLEKEVIKYETVTDKNGKTRQVEKKEYINKTSIGSGTLKDGFSIVINNPTYRPHNPYGRIPERYRLVFSGTTTNRLFGDPGDARVNTDIIIDTNIISEYDFALRKTTNNRGVTHYSFVLQ